MFIESPILIEVPWNLGWSVAVYLYKNESKIKEFVVETYAQNGEVFQSLTLELVKTNNL